MKVIKAILIGILGLLILLFASLVTLYMVRINDIRLQQSHMDDLALLYQDYQSIDESQFYAFDISDESIKLNDIQLLASHNSYKKTGLALGRLFVGLGDSFAEARALKYGYLSLTNQFELGIRSMEFDVRLRNETFEITHVPLVDSSSVAVDFKRALEEIKLYSTNNPNHLPMIFIIEMKDDWMVLDPSLNAFDQEALIQFDALIQEVMTDSLMTPQDIISDGKTLRQTIKEDGWPSLNTLLGRSFFVIHPGTYSQMYANIDPNLDQLSVFIGAYSDQSLEPYASFFVENNPFDEEIPGLIEENFMVRTRIDANLIFDRVRMEQAIASGAQILTSDFLVGRSDIKPQDIIYLSEGKMVIRKS